MTYSFSTSQPSQVKGLQGYSVKPILTVGDTIAGYASPGLIKGISAFLVNSSTVRFLVSHDLLSTDSYPYFLANGTQLRGSRISYFDVDKYTLRIANAGLAFDRIINRKGEVVNAASDLEFNGLRSFGSSALFEANQFGVNTGLANRIYFTGEATSNGTQFALDPESNTLYALPALGRAAWNSMTEINTGRTDKVAFIIGDSRSNNPLYLYVGDKQSGSFLQQNGLAQGKLFAWVADDPNNAFDPIERDPSHFKGSGNGINGRFVEISYYDPTKANTTGYDTLGYATQSSQDYLASLVSAFKFGVSQKVATNPTDGTQAVLAATGSSAGPDVWGTIYKIDVDFNDINAGSINARIDILYDGNDAGKQDLGLRSPDNLEWADNGKIYIQEDRSIAAFGQTSGQEASIFVLDPTATDPAASLTRIAQIDRGSLPASQSDSSPSDIGNWETSGILDVSTLFGNAPGTLFIFGVQAHSLRDGSIITATGQDVNGDGNTTRQENLVEGGQLSFLYTSSLAISPVNTQIAEGDSGTTPLSFTVTRSGDTSVASSAYWAVWGSGANPADSADFGGNLPSGTVEFAIGETTKIITVNVSGDTVVETDEEFSLILASPLNSAISTSTAVVTITADDDNQAPTDLILSASSFNENIAADSTVATLSTSDPDIGNTFTYNLVAGIGDSDNSAFSINGNQLKIIAAPDFESKASYSIRLRSTDQGGLFFERAVSLTVNDLNEAPTDLSISATAFIENIAAGTAVATLSSTDPDTANTFSYSLVSGSGDTDNNAFSIAGNQLSIKASPDFEAKSSYSIRVRSTDQGGLSVERAVAFTVINLNETPTISIVNDNAGLIQGSVTAGGRTDDRTPTITGTISTALAAGETLRIFNGSSLLGGATVDNTALTWSYTPTLPTTEGTTYRITARVADAAGNLGAASPARAFILDTTPPATTAAITGVSDNVGIIQGTIANNGRTDDRTPTITGTISTALAAGETLRIFNGSSLLGRATVDNTALTWSYTPTLPTTEGTTYSITARVVDAAGNLGTASAARSFVLDTTPPATTAAITAVTDNVGLIQGSVTAGGRTDDTTPTITGTISAALADGETLRIFNGSSLLGGATVDNTALTWSYTPTLPTTEGTTYRITARVADAAGNLGAASPARAFILDTTPPATTAAITGVSDNVGIIQGTIANNGRTDDRTPTITGAISTALAAGETLRIFNGSSLLGRATVDNTALTWSYTPTLPTTEGTNYSITARVVDAAGNLGTASAAHSFVLDTTPPAPTPAITGVSGNDADNRLTGLGGKDILTGGGGTADRDVFVFLQLSDSLLLDPISGTGGYFDEITDFNSNDRITAPSSVTASLLTISVGTAASIAPAAIAAVLTPAAFGANSVAALTASSHAGTFIAMNDGRAGFQADTDSIVWLRNYSISATNFVEFV